MVAGKYLSVSHCLLRLSEVAGENAVSVTKHEAVVLELRRLGLVGMRCTGSPSDRLVCVQSTLEACTEAGVPSLCRFGCFSNVSFLVEVKFVGSQMQSRGRGMLPTASRGCAWDMLVGFCRG